MSALTQSSLNYSDVGMLGHKRERQLSIDNVRQAQLSDVPVIKRLMNSETDNLFGNVNEAEILDKCHMSVCIENIQKEAVAFMCLDGHPNIPSIPPWEWNHWLYNIYHLELLTPRNTLWIHLTVWESCYTFAFTRPLLKMVFADQNFLEYIVLVIPPGVSNTEWLKGLGTRILPEGFSDPFKVQTLFLLVRQHFVTKYKIRRAVEEDNDDLVPLIHMYSERLQQHYGEFYIAELLTRHTDSGRQLIVAEHEEQAVAVLCLNEIVNYKLLNEAFELVPFYGLKKPHADDQILHQMTSQMSTMLWPQDDDREEPGISLTYPELKITKPTEEDSIGTFGSEEIELAITETTSEQSIDQFSIVNVSSIHIDMDRMLEDYASSSSSSNSEFSAMILSFDDYEKHLFADRSGLRTVSFDDLEHHSSRLMKPHTYVPKVNSFYGEPNAFMLELATAHPEHEVESLGLLLEAAFECFPDRDYCVLSIPSTCPPFPLLKHFARAAPRPVKTYPQELYILHRNVVLSNMSARIAVRTDIPIIQELTETMSKIESLRSNFISAVHETDDYRAFVLLSEDQIVGVAVIREEEDFEYLKSHYELIYWIDETHHKPGSHGLLEHIVLSPVFNQHSRFFLREIHRLSDFSALYYHITPSDVSAVERERSLCCVISDLIPVRSRPIPEFTQTNLDGCAPADVIHRVDDPFALYLSTARHCTLPRYEINRMIVVVGTSDTALAFLDSLLCSWSLSYYVTFTNVTVISPHGMPYQKSDNRVRNMMFPRRSNCNYRHMHLSSLRTYVNIVYAVMTGIDRKNKLLIVNDSNYLAYDLLFIMCGEQFQKPPIQASQKDKKQKSRFAEFPENVFLINTEKDANYSMLKLQALTTYHQKKEYTVIVYGYSLEAYCCLAALLEYGVPGVNIAFVESFPVISENKFYHRVSHFNDGEVDEAVQAAILSEDITVYSSYYFVEWCLDKSINQITSARFESRHKKVVINCIAMFMYNDKTVSARTFLAINQAGLVFDGGLVVGSDCRTNDPSIYGAGTITKYSRRYYAEHMAHKYFNLEEIGYKLGQHIRRKLLMPFCNEPDDTGPITCERGNMLVPTYEKPLMTYCNLPGNLRYLKVTKPGKQVPLEVAMSSDEYGQVLVTGDCKQIDKQGYFRLHLNPHGVVETITCLAKFDIDHMNLTSLWGKHEKLLNNLQMRFEMILITDLFAYFREPWTCAIYHDRFPLLEKNINKLLTSFTDIPGESLLEDVLGMFKANDWTQLTEEQTEEIEEKFTNSPYHKQLEMTVLDFLRDNDTFLPMYAHPLIITMLLQGFENSPLFRPQ